MGITLLKDYNTLVMDTLNEKSTVFKPSFAGKSFPWKDDAQNKLAVLMSGGVDSGVAALLLQRQGYDVAGVTMDLFGGGRSAVRSAAEVCHALSIPHFYADISAEFRRLVISPFCGAYREGKTPNPCAVCNERIKFGAVIDRMEQAWGSDFDIATGHYAKIMRKSGRAFLARAAFKKKDQSYFLSGIRSRLLERLHFPLGWLSDKEEVRKIAREAALQAAEKPESMEICFADEDDYRKIIGAPSKPGPIVDTRGKVLGMHGGLTSYTLGQRKGLGVSSPFPLFVVDIRVRDNTLVAATRGEAFQKTVTADCLNVLIEEEIRENNVLYGKIRSQGEPQACRVVRIGVDTISVEFTEPVFAPAPGQRLALYTSGALVAAGGVITRG